MRIQPYSVDKFDQCIALFISNMGKFFADYELAEFKSFLDYAATSNTYYVVIEDDMVVACGGYELVKGQMVLTWGMVKREFHGRGYGKALTLYRLDAIKSAAAGSVMIDTSQHTRGFYEKQGFQVQSMEKDGFDQGLDKYNMVLSF